MKPVALPPMRVCVVTSEWPSAETSNAGVFVQLQVEMLRLHGAEVDVYPFRGRGYPHLYARFWFGLRAHLRAQPCDIIHAHFGQSGLIVLPTTTPFVVTFHGSDLEGSIGRNGRSTLRGRALVLISKMVARRADAVILVSESLRKYLPTDTAATVVPGGVDTSVFRVMDFRECRSSLGWDADDFIVLFAADPENPIKRYALADAAVALLPPWMRARLVVAWGLDHSVVPAYMNAADVLLLSSKSEGSPTVVKEALACGLPVVATNVGDAAARLKSVRGSRVCADDSAESLAAALADAYHEKATSGRPAQALDAVHDEARNAARLMDIYARLYAGRLAP